MIGFGLLLGFKILSAGACPSSEQVERELQDLRGAAPIGSRQALEARVIATDGGVRIVLANATGAHAYEKTIATTEGCASKAKAAALVLAAYEANYEEVALVAAPAPASQSDRAPSATRQVSVGAGLAVEQARLLPSVSFEVGARFVTANASAFSRLRFATANSASIDNGSARWTHLLPSLGVRKTLSLGPSEVGISAEVLLVRTAASGNGFAVNSRATSYVPSIAVGPSLSWKLKDSTAIWVELGLVTKLATQRLVVKDADGASVERAIARNQIWLITGLSFSQ